MPVFLFTIHAYRSWNADHPKGYVRRGEGILPPNQMVAKAYDQHAKESQAVFGANEQRAMAWIVWDACQNRNWRLHALAFEPTHIHVLVSWRDEHRMANVCTKLKNLISRELNLRLSIKRRWLSRGASRRQVKDREHFDHLVKRYLPRHGGLVWLEGMPPPEPPGTDPSASADG